MRRIALICFLSVLSAGVAHAGLFSDDAAHRKIADLQKQNTQLQQQLNTLETRLAQLEKSVQNQGLVDLLAQVESLRAEMSQLRGQIEVNSHAVQMAQKRQQDFYVDLDSRIKRLETGSTAAASGGASGVGAPGVGIPGGAAPTSSPANPGAVPQNGAGQTSGPAAPGAKASVDIAKPTPGAGNVSGSGADGASEAASYEAALGQFRAGNYPEAVTSFQIFLKRFPTSVFAPSAQYWIGNAQFAQKDFRGAIASQQKLVSNYPGSQKVPDAMLNMASAQIELGDHAAARRTLQELIAKHPITPAADLAKKRLETLK